MEPVLAHIATVIILPRNSTRQLLTDVVAFRGHYGGCHHVNRCPIVQDTMIVIYTCAVIQNRDISAIR